VVELLPNMLEALGSAPVPKNKKTELSKNEILES
jgi:hypothetical protein